MPDTVAEDLPLIVEPAPLSVQDRCDRCQAQAKARVILNSGGELLFCAHHAKKYETALAPLAASIFIEEDATGS